MNAIRNTFAAVLAMAGMFVAAETAKAEHIDDLAYQLQSQTRRLYREVRAHYRHTSQYRHLANDTYKMYRLAGHIHELAHHQEDIHHIHDDLHELDELYHHVDELIDDIEHTSFHDPYGHHGHIHGDTHHVRELMGSIDVTMHHLLEDVEHITHADPHGPVIVQEPVIVERPVIVQPRSRPRPGIEFGNGRFQIRVQP
jgi:hypothetical protein